MNREAIAKLSARRDPSHYLCHVCADSGMARMATQYVIGGEDTWSTVCTEHGDPDYPFPAVFVGPDGEEYPAVIVGGVLRWFDGDGNQLGKTPIAEPKAEPPKLEPKRELPPSGEPPTPARRQPTDAPHSRWRIDLEDLLNFTMGIAIVVFLVWWIFLAENEDPPPAPAPQDIGTRIDRMPVDPIVPEVPEGTRLAP